MRAPPACLLLACLLAPCLLTGCDDMNAQPKRNAYSTAQVGPGPVPAQTVRFDETPESRPKLTDVLMERGQDEFRAFCVPCHGEAGQGNGMVVQRGFSAPPSYHIPHFRAVSDQFLYDVITNGYGAMYGFAQRVRPADRWAIVAYVRALQRSQDARLADLSPAERQSLP